MTRPASGDLFGYTKPRPKPRVMMHAVDVGQAPGMMPGWRTAKGAQFVCRKCGYDAGWLFDMQDSEVRRGVPCPVCNNEPPG